MLLGFKDQLVSKVIHNFVYAIQISINSFLCTKVQAFGYPRFIIYYANVFPQIWGNDL
jgi:hypothetical protein